jgi:hypothetical protein
MSTTPQGSTTSNQDEINLTTTTTTTTITVTEQDYIVIEDETDCRRNEAFDLPKTKKFKSTTTIISNGSDPTIMSSNGNGNNLVETMEHTNGAVNYNGVSFFLPYHEISLIIFEILVFLREKINNHKKNMVYFRTNFCFKSTFNSTHLLFHVSVSYFLVLFLRLTSTDICF